MIFFVVVAVWCLEFSYSLDINLLWDEMENIFFRSVFFCLLLIMFFDAQKV